MTARRVLRRVFGLVCLKTSEIMLNQKKMWEKNFHEMDFFFAIPNLTPASSYQLVILWFKLS